MGIAEECDDDEMHQSITSHSSTYASSTQIFEEMFGSKHESKHQKCSVTKSKKSCTFKPITEGSVFELERMDTVCSELQQINFNKQRSNCNSSGVHSDRSPLHGYSRSCTPAKQHAIATTGSVVSVRSHTSSSFLQDIGCGRDSHDGLTSPVVACEIQQYDYGYGVCGVGDWLEQLDKK